MSPWAPWVVLGMVALAAVGGWLLVARRRRDSRDRTVVANTGYLYALPSFRRRLAMHRIAALGVTGNGAA